MSGIICDFAAVKLTLKCRRGPPGPNISFFASPVRVFLKLDRAPNYFFLRFFFLLYFFFLLFLLLTICSFFHMLHQISTKLGQIDQWVIGYKIGQQFDLEVYLGFTGVKMYFLWKMLLLVQLI